MQKISFAGEGFGVGIQTPPPRAYPILAPVEVSALSFGFRKKKARCYTMHMGNENHATIFLIEVMKHDFL